MTDVIRALVPVFLLIGLGLALRRADFPGNAFWEPLERLIYFLLFPALLVRSLAEARFDLAALAPMLAAVLGGLLILAAVLVLIRPVLTVSGPAFTSVFQGAIRFNTYVALGSAGPLFGSDGVAMLAVVLALTIPTINVLCVLVLTRFGEGRSNGWGASFLEMARNPLIIACLTGIFLNLTGIGMPRLLSILLKPLGDASLAFGLLAVGAALRFTAMRGAGQAVLVACGFKLLFLPLVVVGLAALFGVSALALKVAILYAAMPTAPSAYILAARLGGDAALMAGLITAETLVAVVTLPTMLTLLA